MSTAERLYEEALSLPPAEREALGLRLLDSAGPPGVRHIDDPWWEGELRRRDAEMVSGEDPGVPWEEIKAGWMALLSGDAARHLEWSAREEADESFFRHFEMSRSTAPALPQPSNGRSTRCSTTQVQAHP